MRVRLDLRRAKDRHRPTWPSRSQWAVLIGLVPALGAVAARRRLRLPPVVSLALISVAPVATAAATPRRPWRYAAVGAVYMWCFAVTWTLPYEDRETLRRRLAIRYPVLIDRILGLGQPPTQRLQRRLRTPGRVNAVDRAVTAAYASWFLPHLLLAWLLTRHPQYVPRAAGRLAAAYHLTTPFYYAIPTAPPWWASEEAGLMGGEVVRVRRHVLQEVTHRRQRGEDSSGGNPWASMPSDHVASAAITAMGLAEVSSGYGALGWAYVGVSMFSVVYLGEHYLIDALVGLAVAEGIKRGEAAAAPLVRHVVTGLERFSR